MNRIAVIGSGTMGHGIAQVCAMAGYDVRLNDVNQAALDAALTKVEANLDKGVARGKVSADVRDLALAKLSVETDFDTAVRDTDCIIEAIPEKLEWKTSLFQRAEAVAPDT